MKLSATHIGSQLRLADIRDERMIRTSQQARAISGLMVEEAVRDLIGATRHQIDSTADYCPDLELGPDHMLEVKLVSSGGSLRLFADRVANDRALVASGKRLTYLIVKCDRQPALPCRRDDFRRQLLAACREVVVIGFERLRGAVFRRKLVKLWLEERPGWRIGMAEIERRARGCAATAIRPPISGDFLPSVTGQHDRLARPLTTEQRQGLRALLRELATYYLDVVLAPAPEAKHRGHKVRVVQNRNPDWYQQLAACSPGQNRRKKPAASRKQDTQLRRYYLVRAIDRMLVRGAPRYPYDWLALDILKQPAPDGWPC